MQIIIPTHLEKRATDLIQKSDYLKNQTKPWHKELELCIDIDDYKIIRHQLEKRYSEIYKLESLLNEILDVIPSHQVLSLFE